MDRLFVEKVSLSLAIITACLLLSKSVVASDSDSSRQTLSGIKGVYVLVEDLQPNIKKSASRSNFSTEQLQKDVELRLKKAVITVLNRDEWLKTPGQPVLYINVNTHEREKYWWAYDIKLELQQIASLEANPKVKALVNTWSVNMTGIVNIGTLNTLTDQVKTLTDIFIKAYRSVNPR